MDELPAIKTFPPPSIKSVKASVSRSPPKSGRNQEKTKSNVRRLFTAEWLHYLEAKRVTNCTSLTNRQ